MSFFSRCLWSVWKSPTLQPFLVWPQLKNRWPWPDKLHTSQWEPGVTRWWNKTLFCFFFKQADSGSDNLMARYRRQAGSLGGISRIRSDTSRVNIRCSVRKQSAGTNNITHDPAMSLRCGLIVCGLSSHADYQGAAEQERSAGEAQREGRQPKQISSCDTCFYLYIICYGIQWGAQTGIISKHWQGQCWL